MTPSNIPAQLRRLVIERANGRCEYCLVRSSDVLLPHEPDHILATKHGGRTTADNLALACIHCNRRKGSDLASIDSVTGQVTPLFNPRTQDWPEHFSLSGAHIAPLSPEGRVTVALLQLNHPDRLRVREAMVKAGRYPQ